MRRIASSPVEAGILQNHDIGNGLSLAAWVAKDVELRHRLKVRKFVAQQTVLLMERGELVDYAVYGTILGPATLLLARHKILQETFDRAAQILRITSRLANEIITDADIQRALRCGAGMPHGFAARSQGSICA